MPLTRPRFEQLNTIITNFTDPISVLNKGSSLANIDVGFIFNRDGGTSSNVAVFWDESANTFVTSFTTDSGSNNANITITEYANLRVGTITATFVNTTGNIMSSGNVTAPYFFGNGSQLSGVITSVTKIINGTSDVTAYSGGNVAVTVGGTANTVVFTSSNIHVTGSIIPSANVTYDLGSSSNRFRSAYFAGSTIYIGNTEISESTIAAIESFPSGDYGDLITSSSDAFGVQSATSFDLNTAGTVSTIDLEVLS